MPWRTCGCWTPSAPAPGRVAGFHWPEPRGATMKKVVVSDNLFEDLEPEREALRGVAELVVFGPYPGPGRFLEAARDAEGIISQMAPLRAEVLDHLERCRVIVRYGVGVDNIDVEAATRNGITVCNVPDYCTEDVADHTLTLALALIRKLPAAIRQLQTGGWGHAIHRPIRRLSALTFGTWGFGRIARSVQQRAGAFGFRRIAHDPYVPASAFAPTGVECVDVETLLAESDLLALHMPLTDGTHHLLNRETLSRMKPGALVVNTARGGLIDSVALQE
ncbi:MAG: C-terminal binding protein, partial [Armatimonadetes bacterium]|nr:C-terminal binding protein [Armatimonadota bacterium]